MCETCCPAPGEDAGRIIVVQDKNVQFRSNVVYQFTQHLAIVKHLLASMNIIYIASPFFSAWI